jgi:hypothetical protein
VPSAFPTKRTGSHLSTRPQCAAVTGTWRAAVVRTITTMLLAATLDVCTGPAATASPAIAGPSASPNERVTVALGVFGDFPSLVLDTLTRLLEPEMEHAELTLKVSQQAMALRAWVDGERKDPHVLLLAALDVQPHEDWRLVLVDAARGRAVIRDLPGGVTRDRAALEAIASMIASAAHALQEGLAVASRSVDDALSETTHPPDVIAAPAISPPPRVSNHVRVRGAAGFGVASFEHDAPVSYGVSVELALLVEHFGLQLTLARYRPQEFRPAPGSFEIDRTAFAIASIARREWRSLAGEVGIGAAAELLERGGTVANGAAAATPVLGGSTLVRYGPLVELAGSVRLAPYLSLSVGSGWSYFPQRIRYLESGTMPTTLASPWPVVASGRIVLEVLLP